MDKIRDIRLNIVPSLYDPSVPLICTSILYQFEPVTLPFLQDIVGLLKPSGSALDVLLRVLVKVKPFLPFKDFEKVIHAFVSTRLDYCNSLYVGINQSSFARLQMIQNAAARLLTGVRKREHITPVLISLHWLPVRFRIDFKVLLLVFKCLNGLAPEYLSDLLSIHNPVRSLRSSNQRQLNVQRARLKLRGDHAFSIAAPKLCTVKS